MSCCTLDRIKLSMTVNDQDTSHSFLLRARLLVFAFKLEIHHDEQGFHLSIILAGILNLLSIAVATIGL